MTRPLAATEKLIASYMIIRINQISQRNTDILESLQHLMTQEVVMRYETHHHRRGAGSQGGRNHRGNGCFGPRGPHGNHIMGTVTVDGRGQLVVPREARDALSIQAGDRFVVFGNERRRSLHLVSADYFDSFADMLLSRSNHLEKLARDIRGMSGDENPRETEGPDEDADGRPDGDDASPSTPDVGRLKE